jgi:hypothetical protein
MRSLPILSVAVVLFCGGPHTPADDATVDLPLVALARGLPSPKACADALALNALWAALGEREAEARGENWYTLEAYSILSSRRFYWERAAYAVDVEAEEAGRRRALGTLVRDLGWNAVLTGRIPNPVPLEWFKE